MCYLACCSSFIKLLIKITVGNKKSFVYISFTIIRRFRQHVHWILKERECDPHDNMTDKHTPCESVTLHSDLYSRLMLLRSDCFLILYFLVSRIVLYNEFHKFIYLFHIDYNKFLNSIVHAT